VAGWLAYWREEKSKNGVWKSGEVWRLFMLFINAGLPQLVDDPMNALGVRYMRK